MIYTRQRALCRVPTNKHSVEIILIFLKNCAECRAGRHMVNHTLPSALLGHSTKYISIFLFFQPNFLWFVPTLCRLTYSIFSTIIKVFAITIRFCSFNLIFLDNSDMNCKSLEKCKTVNAKIIFMLFSTSYDQFQKQTRIFEHRVQET
jgi:hypothetical protein